MQIKLLPLPFPDIIEENAKGCQERMYQMIWVAGNIVYINRDLFTDDH